MMDVHASAEVHAVHWQSPGHLSGCHAARCRDDDVVTGVVG